MEKAISLISTLNEPVEFLDPPVDLKNKCLSILPHLFSFAANLCDEEDVPVRELHIEGFETEDIWRQIEMISEPVLNKIEDKGFDFLHRNGIVNILKPAVKDSIQGECSVEQTVARESDSEEGQIDDDKDSMEEASFSDGEENELEEEEVKNENEQRQDATGGDGDVADDQFFSLSEMEAFVKSAEEGVMEDWDSDGSIDLFEEDAGEDAEFDIDEEDQHSDSDPEEGDRYFYKDFFDPPPPSSKADSLPVDVPLSKHQKRQKKLADHIARLETRNLEEKPWQMGGEASSNIREENSLLQEDLLYEHVSRPAPEITEEVTFALEDIIKQRIIDKAWDDVERKEKPKEQPFNYRIARPLDQEKSKQSLAEVYEQEYLKQMQVDKEEQSNPRHEEIRKMMDKLFAELDSLANFHFTPKVPEPEIKTIPNLPSIALEEVAPVTYSNTMLLAPEELQAKSFRTEIGQSERSVTDRKRERRRKKKFQHLNKDKLQQRKEMRGKLRLLKKAGSSSSGEFGAMKSSNKFFAELSEKVKSHVHNKKRTDQTQINSLSKHEHKLRHLKL